jgi:hypothetical protein
MNQQINLQNPNIPLVQIQQTNSHPMTNDPDYPRWVYLYTNNRKDTQEGTRLYQNLSNRYGETPIKVLKGHT